MQAIPYARAVARLVLVAVAAVTVVAVAPSSATAAAADGAGAYVSMSPVRFLDTRVVDGAAAATPAVGALVDVPIAGQRGIPQVGVTAVVVNVVVTGARRDGYVQALPTGSGTPGASSNINVTAGQTATNLITVPVGAGGSITLYDMAGGHLVVDVSGYFLETSQSAAGRYTALSAPKRVLDSRDRTGLTPVAPPATLPTASGPAPARPRDLDCGDFAGSWEAANKWFWDYYPYFGDIGRLDTDDDLIPCEWFANAPKAPQAPYDHNPMPAAGTFVTLPMRGHAPLPLGVSAVALTVTATQSARAGFVQVVPGGTTTFGQTSNVNLTGAGQTVANLAIVPVGPDGAISLYTSGGTHLIADVVGYFTDATAPTTATGLFVPVLPERVLDTRSSTALGDRSLTMLDRRMSPQVPVGGGSAVFLNVTATEASAAGYLQLLPSVTGTVGASSSVNYAPGQTAANAAIGSFSASGLSLYAYSRTHVVLDLMGYFI